MKSQFWTQNTTVLDASCNPICKEVKRLLTYQLESVGDEAIHWIPHWTFALADCIITLYRCVWDCSWYWLWSCCLLFGFGYAFVILFSSDIAITSIFGIFLFSTSSTAVSFRRVFSHTKVTLTRNFSAFGKTAIIFATCYNLKRWGTEANIMQFCARIFDKQHFSPKQKHWPENKHTSLR